MANSPEEINKGKGDLAPSLAIMGCLVTGLLACIGGLSGVVRDDLGGAGFCFLAAAVAFGIVVYVSFSD
jgi:hypothetical protein